MFMSFTRFKPRPRALSAAAGSRSRSSTLARFKPWPQREALHGFVARPFRADRPRLRPPSTRLRPYVHAPPARRARA